jgi:hypothetical protein
MMLLGVKRRLMDEKRKLRPYVNRQKMLIFTIIECKNITFYKLNMPSRREK